MRTTPRARWWNQQSNYSDEAIERSSHQAIKPSSHQTIKPSNNRGIEASRHRGIEASGHQAIKPSERTVAEWAPESARTEEASPL
eukprot:5320161-Prymnesium_polylepis.1